MDRKIVAINGCIGSGKDTFSKTFIEDGYYRMSFATNLKDSVSAIFGWDREMLEGVTDEARKIREQPDPFWCKRLELDCVSPRWILQNYGTNILRKHFHNDIWVFSLERDMMQIDGNIIITDCRFPNELKMIRANGGCVIEVQRNLPQWYFDAYTYNVRGGVKPESLNSIHESEWAWIGINKPEHVVKNESTVEELEKIARWILHGINDQL